MYIYINIHGTHIYKYTSFLQYSLTTNNNKSNINDNENNDNNKSNSKQ